MTSLKNHLLAGVVVLLVSVVACLGQTDVELRDRLLQTGFTSEELSETDNGRTIVKLLAERDKRDVAVCGLLRLEESPQTVLKLFQQNSAHQNGKKLIMRGRFSEHPSLSDVENLTLESRDIEDLKKCVVGDCKIKLSAAMITRFKTEVDWNSSDYAAQATLLFRKILVDYVKDYLARGNAGLIEYADQVPAIRVEEEQTSLLQSAVHINEFAPELSEYLRAYPALKRTDLETSINWVKIKFGLKPVIIITHVITTKPSSDPANKVFTATKQIYANHYFDSSLSLTLALAPANSRTSYLLYANHTRADALDGPLSPLKRRIARREAVDSLSKLLDQARLNLHIHIANRSDEQKAPATNMFVDPVFGRRRLLWWLVAIAAAVLFVKLIRNSKFIRTLKLRRTDSGPSLQ